MHKNILLCIGITILFLGMSITISDSNIIKYKLTPELIIDGPIYGHRGQTLEYTLILTDQGECEIWYYVDWDDRTFEDWIGPFDGFEEVIVSHSWSENRIYELRAKAMDYFNESNWATYVVNIGDEPPDKPYIDGPHRWPVGVKRYALHFIQQTLMEIM